MPKQVVFVGMSGGVDSSVAAALLQERGFDVHGVHIKMWSDPTIPCQFKEDRRDALRVADKLNIPFETWDLTDEYRTFVVDYMIREYAAGRTPNPDVMCNRKIKFGIFLQKATERGANFIATGHYVRLGKESGIWNAESGKINSKFKIPNSKFELLEAKDKNKDQSYFLWTLTQEQLQYCLFPIGEYTKPQVRELAKKFGLSTAEKPDSQGICFIGEIDLNNYLKQYIPVARGRMLTTAGNDIGEHDGLAFYTIGQRAGLKVGGGIPYYVAKKDFATNTLVVGKGPFDEQLFSSVLIACDAHWISGQEPEFPLKCKARIRYRQPMQDAIVKKGADNKISVIFDEPQRAITPGQSVVWYHDDEMLGGACIF